MMLFIRNKSCTKKSKGQSAAKNFFASFLGQEETKLMAEVVLN